MELIFAKETIKTLSDILFSTDHNMFMNEEITPINYDRNKSKRLIIVIITTEK